MRVCFQRFDELSVTRMKGRLVYYSVTGELIVDQKIKHRYFLGTCSDRINFRSTLDDRWSGFLFVIIKGWQRLHRVASLLYKSIIYVTHCGLVTLYGEIDLSQHWHKIAWQHQAVTGTSVDLWSVNGIRTETNFTIFILFLYSIFISIHLSNLLLAVIC